MHKGYLLYLYAAFGLITLLVILTKGKPSLARRRLLLGLLIFSLTAPAAALVSCKSGEKKIVQKDIWQTDGWVDEDTCRIYAAGTPRQGLTNKIQRKGSAKESAVLIARKGLMERFKPVRIESCAGMADYGYYEYSFAESEELNAVIKGGAVVAEKFDDQDNCEIIYEVKSRGLKKKIAGEASE